MRNRYIEAQLRNMLNSMAVFRQGCRMAALRDDKVVDKEEEKILKAITAATDKYEKELNKILEKY